MNRIFKYRAWIDEGQKFVYPTRITFFDDVIYVYSPDDDYEYQITPDHLHQYVRLRDTNGVEIYERDVCKVIGGWSGVVAAQKMYDLNNFHFWDEVRQNLEAGASYEVIGNTLQNPELLEVHA